MTYEYAALPILFLGLGFLIPLPQSPAQSAESGPDVRMVEISSLNPTYYSCSSIDFLVRNISAHEFYAEVYVENFNSGSWHDDVFPYGLHAPINLYEKRVLTDKDKLSPGQSWHISYDRCLRPKFVKENGTAFRKAIIESDEKAKSQVLQRIRVEMYWREEARLKLLQKDWSSSFKRTAPPDQKPCL